MNLKDAAKSVLEQLSQLIVQLKAEEYSTPILRLGNSTIGEHVRHTIEFFICMKDGSSEGIINYDNRSRDIHLEESSEAALLKIADISDYLDSADLRQPLKLQIDYGMEGHNLITLSTNFERELAYNIEHAIHHMAILKVGVSEVSPKIKIPEGFGIAVSTLRYRKDQVQTI